MNIDDFIEANQTLLKQKGAVVLVHKGFSKKSRFGEQILANQRFDADGDPLKRVFVKPLVRGQYVLPYEYSEAGWEEYKPAPQVKEIRKKIYESENKE
jgi:hypothetical protein